MLVSEYYSKGLYKKRLSFFFQQGTCPIIDVGILMQYVCVISLEKQKTYFLKLLIIYTYDLHLYNSRALPENYNLLQMFSLGLLLYLLTAKFGII